MRTDQPVYGTLIQGSDGSFYGMTYAGGANAKGTVFKITAAGVETVLWSFGAGTDAQGPYGRLVQGGDGNFYGMTEEGGVNDVGSIIQITPAGAETVLWSFGSGLDASYPCGDVTFGADGTIYGLIYYGGTYGYGAVIQFN